MLIYKICQDFFDIHNIILLGIVVNLKGSSYSTNRNGPINPNPLFLQQFHDGFFPGSSRVVLTLSSMGDFNDQNKSPLKGGQTKVFGSFFIILYWFSQKCSERGSKSFNFYTVILRSFRLSEARYLGPRHRNRTGIYYNVYVYIFSLSFLRVIIVLLIEYSFSFYNFL